MSVECRRLDKLEEAIVRSDNIHGALSYCISLSHQYVNHREYRFEVIACYDTLSVFIFSCYMLDPNAMILIHS
jgi:hypothetical protein